MSTASGLGVSTPKGAPCEVAGGPSASGVPARAHLGFPMGVRSVSGSGVQALRGERGPDDIGAETGSLSTAQTGWGQSQPRGKGPDLYYSTSFVTRLCLRSLLTR